MREKTSKSPWVGTMEKSTFNSGLIYNKINKCSRLHFFLIKLIYFLILFLKLHGDKNKKEQIMLFLIGIKFRAAFSESLLLSNFF